MDAGRVGENVELQLRPGLEERFESKHDWDVTYMPEQLVSVCGVCRVCCGVVFCSQVILHVCGEHTRSRKRGVFNVQCCCCLCRKDTM